MKTSDRLAIVIEFVAAADGEFFAGIFIARWSAIKAQLTYSGVGPWLEGRGCGAGEGGDVESDLAAQLKLQDEASVALRDQRHRLGALGVRSSLNRKRWCRTGMCTR